MSCTIIPSAAAIGAGSAALSRWYSCYDTQIECDDVSSYAKVGAITGLGVGILIISTIACCFSGERKNRKVIKEEVGAAECMVDLKTMISGINNKTKSA